MFVFRPYIRSNRSYCAIHASVIPYFQNLSLDDKDRPDSINYGTVSSC